MSNQDFAIGVTSALPTVGAINKKPVYLITLESFNGKSKVLKRFIALDKPDAQNGFIQVKGIYSNLAEDDIIEKFSDLLTSLKKELILEVWFPCDKVYSIRSLTFNAVKTSTVLKNT